MNNNEILERCKSLESRQRELLQEIIEIQGLLNQPVPEKETEVPVMLSLREASGRTGVSYEMLRKLCMNKQVRHIMSGKKILINFGSLCRYLNEGGAA